MKHASLVVLVILTVVGGCLTSYNSVKWTPLEGAPAVDERPSGCNVDVFEDGQKVTRPHADIGQIVLEWPLSKIKEQGPEGAIKTLKQAACERGAFMVTDMRALPNNEGGMVYEATLATLLGDDGRPVNLTKEKPKATPAAAAAGDARAPSGW